MSPSIGSHRFKKREWKNINSGYTRRARWFDNGAQSIRIHLEDQFFALNKFFVSKDDAMILWRTFIALDPIPKDYQGKMFSVVKTACILTGNMDASHEKYRATWGIVDEFFGGEIPDDVHAIVRVPDDAPAEG